MSYGPPHGKKLDEEIKRKAAESKKPTAEPAKAHEPEKHDADHDAGKHKKGGKR